MLRRVLFVFGCFFVVPSIVAVFLGLIQHGRLQKEPSYRSKPPPLLYGHAVQRVSRLRSTHEPVSRHYDLMFAACWYWGCNELCLQCQLLQAMGNDVRARPCCMHSKHLTGGNPCCA